MVRASRLHILILAAALLAVLLGACSSDDQISATTEAISTTQPTAVAVEEDELDNSSLEEETESPEFPDSDLTAIIISGESAGTGKPFTFDATQSETGRLDIVHYQWNMGDGTTLFGISVQHAYESPGLYTVTLTVVDEEGNTDTTATVVEVIELTEEPSIPAADEFTLVGSSWALDYPLRGTTLTLEFEQESVSGSAGCNTFSAGYTADVSEGSPSDIAIDPVTFDSAQMCTAEIMSQEKGYIDSLASASTITIIGQTLTLETDSGTLTFTQIEASG